MCDSGIDDFPAADDDTLHAGMATAAKLGLPVAVHAERPARLRTPEGSDWRAWVASRPVEAELEAIETAIAHRARDRLLAARRARELRRGRRARGGADGVTCETCPHYLTLSEDDLETLGTRAKCAPPLRPAAEREALWRQLEAGRIALVASDHSPCPPEMKAGRFRGGLGRDRRRAGDAGAPARAGCRRTVADLTSANPAARFGLPKGRLEPGADADLVLVDLRDRHVPELQDRHRLSPFAGRPLPRVVRTLGPRRRRPAAVSITPRKDTA